MGRITLGASSSTERFKDSDLNGNTNDTFFSSQRIFYKISEMGTNEWEFTTDLRNKYDLFDKLNKELLQLDAKNEFQARQFYVRMVNASGQLSPSLGRFQIPEAGAVFVDGADLQYRFNTDWYSGIFGGLNPKQLDKSYLVADPKASQSGIYLTYQKKINDWDTNLYFTHSFVQQTYSNEIERQFIFHNFIYQWEEESRIISMAYLDFVPHSYAQTLYLIYQQKINKFLNSEIGTLEIDAIEYQHRQNLLEKLAPSSYKENHLDFDYKIDQDKTLSLLVSSGTRSIDHLSRVDSNLAYRIQSFITQNWDTQFKLTNRKNFTSEDMLFSWNLGYFSNKYEVVFDSDYGSQKNNDGITTHPMNSEIGLTSFFSKEIFATVTLQRAMDENVTITGTFLKVGYRFGNQALPPIRDGAAPRGSL